MLGTNRKWLVLRAVVGLTAMTLFFRAIQLMPIGSAVSLRYMAPFFTAIIAVLFLGERMKPLQWLFFLMAFMGVAILKGFDPRISGGALAIILTSAFLSGCVYAIIRKIGNSEHPLVVVNYFMILATIVSGAVCLFYWLEPKGIEWLLLISLGATGFVAQFYMTRGLQIAEANLITPFKYSEVVFTLIAGWFFFGENHSLIAVGAISLIIAALLANVWIGRKKTQSKFD